MTLGLKKNKFCDLVSRILIPRRDLLQTRSIPRDLCEDSKIAEPIADIFASQIVF